MKKILFAISILAFSFTFGQMQKLEFITNVPDAEDSYVVFNDDKGGPYSFGFIYFDEYAGYTFRSLGNIVVENNKLKIINNESNSYSAMSARIGNFNLKMAKLTPDVVKKLNLEPSPQWLKNYKSTSSDNEKMLTRASMMNGAQAPELALPKLLQLYKNNFRTEKVYFELAFSYNAMKDYENAEKIASEALKNNIVTDLIRKEYVFALANQNKLKGLDAYLSSDLPNFTSERDKAEAIINTIAASAHYDDLSMANKWLTKLKSEVDILKYQRNINQLENIIKEKQKKIQ